MRYPIRKQVQMSSNAKIFALFINMPNKAINARMSSRTHNEFGIQFPRKRLPKLPTRQGINETQ